MPRRGGAGEHESGIGIAGLPCPQSEIRISELILAGWDERPHTVYWEPDEPAEAAQFVDRGVDLAVAAGVGQSFDDLFSGENRGEVA